MSYRVNIQPDKSAENSTAVATADSDNIQWRSQNLNVTKSEKS